MNPLKICAQKVIVETRLIKKDESSEGGIICYQCSGYDNKCDGYYTIGEDCVGI